MKRNDFFILVLLSVFLIVGCSEKLNLPEVIVSNKNIVDDVKWEMDVTSVYEGTRKFYPSLQI